MKRPQWWPPALWPARGGPAGDREAKMRYRADEPPGVGSEAAPDSGWESYLDVLVSTLQARRAVLWERRLDRGRWIPVCQRFGSGWSGNAQEAVASPGHPFTWSLREELLLQLPCHRIQGVGDDEGWIMVIPDPGAGRVLSLWFASPPGPGVRESMSAVRSHLAWLGAREGERGEPAGHRRVDN